MVVSIIKSLFFLILFALSFVGLHYYPFSRIISILAPKYKPYSLALSLAVAFCVLSFFLISMLFHKSFFGIPQRITYFWFGFIFFLFFAVLITHVISLMLPLGPRLTILIIFLLALSVVAYALIEGGRLHTKTISLTSSKITKPYSIVLLTDLHVGSNSTSFLQKVVTRVNDLKPDFVTIVGDFIDRDNVTPDDIDMFKALNMPVYYTYGNHEFYVKKDTPEKAIEETQIILLRNKAVIHDELQIIGVDDYRRYRANLEKHMKDIVINPNKYSILLNHQPKEEDIPQSKGVDLILSGHTHGGQIFPFTLFVKLAYRYVYGLYDLGKTKLYVTSGAGIWGPRMRLGSQNEVVLINIVPES
ncbi:MAG: metallophosphoesterase [bacterium]|nr:metallophosphoesterase [bacterium]MBU1918135.1 metallophosphoesterase [bacterium]